MECKGVLLTCFLPFESAYSALGLDLGQSHVVRNAGGSACVLYRPLLNVSVDLTPFHDYSKDALRSIVISQRLLGTREIAVFHHTDCGMLTFSTEQLRKIVKDADGPSAPVDNIDFLEFSDLHTSVKDDVKFLKENPLVLPETTITGWLHHVETGKVEQIV